MTDGAKARLRHAYGPDHLGASFSGVTIEPTNRCPNDCIHCTRSLVLDCPIMDIGLKDVASLVKNIKESGLVRPSTWLHFGFAGEPVIHPKFTSVVETAMAEGWVRIMIYSGLICSEAQFEALETGLSQNYWKNVCVRTSLHFWQHNRQVNRAKLYARCRRIRQVIGERITFSVIPPLAELILPERTRAAKEIGVPIEEVKGRLPSDTFSMHSMLPRCDCIAFTPCSAWGRHITVEGELTLCCLDQKPHVSFGSLFKERFREVWKRKCAFLEDLRQGKIEMPAHCQRCRSVESFRNQLTNGFIH